MLLKNVLLFSATGITIFRGINAVDGDKPNTPNSELQYAIVAGNEQGKFTLESSPRAALVLRKPLDFDAGDTSFNLTIMAAVSPLSPYTKCRCNMCQVAATYLYFNLTHIN